MKRPDFRSIRSKCHGMMIQDVYERIYDVAKEVGSGNFLEIGTGHGAATVCLSLAGGTVYTVDTFRTGGRADYRNTVNDNLHITRENLKYFKVNPTVLIGDPSTIHEKVPSELSLLFLDCDGRIDRDFLLFFHRLAKFSPVIIDDCANRVRLKEKRIDQKHRITYLLVQSAIDHGLLEQVSYVNQTWFGRKIADGPWPLDSILTEYRKLVFATAE